MKTFQIAIAYDTSYDEEFVGILEETAAESGLGSYRVNLLNLDETLGLLQEGSIEFLSYYDRASDTSPRFYKLYRLMKERNVFIFQSLEKQNKAADKAYLHQQFLNAKIPVPKTLIIEKTADQSDYRISESEIEIFDKPFVVKPAVNTGASIGVNLHAFTVEDIFNTCYLGSDDKFLVQQKIAEKTTDIRKFWFRVFYICGAVFCCWWDPKTHRYKRVTSLEITIFNLQALSIHIKKIASICELQFFSTEFALDANDRFVAIDYVNEICDVRLQSGHYDGVPDNVVREISNNLVNYLKRNITNLTKE
jgi:hypothetical protein